MSDPAPLEALIIQQPAGRARQLVLLCHGLGADEQDLAPLGERFAAEYPQALVASLRAPEPSDYGFGFQWFSPTAIDDRTRVERVAAALPALTAAIKDWQRQTGLGPDATLLVGFSQGATMVLEATVVAAETPAPAGRVIALAGRFARLPDAAPRATTLFLVHGKADAMVHYGFTVEAAQHLVGLGADVVADVIPFLGHEITGEVIELVIERLRTHVPRRLWEDAMRGAPPAPGRAQ